MSVWIQDAYERILPESPAGVTTHAAIEGTLGETIAFQVGVRPADRLGEITVELEGRLAAGATVRLAELVPLRRHTIDTEVGMMEGHAPGFVPDPLVSWRGVPFEGSVSRCLWVSLALPGEPGASEVAVTVRSGQQVLGRVVAGVTVWPCRLAEHTLPVTNWFYSDALVDWYRVEPFSEGYWTLVERYFRNMVEHGQTAIYTPLFTPPLDHKKRDLQLVGVTREPDGSFRFDWSLLRRWLALAQACGFRHIEMSHLFSQWGAAHAIRILVRQDGKLVPLFAPETPAASPPVRAFFERFLPELVSLLKAEGLFERTIFHLSDEPKEADLDRYRAVREMVREIVPEVRVTEALSRIDFYRHGLVDDPVPLISDLKPFLDEGLRPWTYYCCTPRGAYPNRFLDVPLYRQRILGAMLFRFGLTGFLHWGLNYWYRGGTTELIDPYQVTDAHRWPSWTAGDPFIVYPGEDGPVDSIRWETFRSAMNDYRLLEAAAASCGRETVQAWLSRIETTAAWPRSSQYLRDLRLRALRSVARPA